MAEISLLGIKYADKFSYGLIPLELRVTEGGHRSSRTQRIASLAWISEFYICS